MSDYDENFLTYLKKEFPYLYDVEMQVRRVQAETGYGDVSIVLQLQNGVVERGEILGSARRLYYKRKNNKLVRLEVPMKVENEQAL